MLEKVVAEVVVTAVVVVTVVVVVVVVRVVGDKQAPEPMPLSTFSANKKC